MVTVPVAALMTSVASFGLVFAAIQVYRGNSGAAVIVAAMVLASTIRYAALIYFDAQDIRQMIADALEPTA